MLTIRMDTRVLSLYQARMLCVLDDLFVSHDEPSPQPRVGLAEIVSELCKVQDEGRTQGWWNGAVMIWSKDLTIFNWDETLNPRPVPLYFITWYDMTWHEMTWHDMTWHDMTSHDMTWHDMTWHDMTWHDMKWHEMTWNDMKWHEMTWNDMKWHHITSHHMTSHHITSHDLAPHF
jgi:hypothetical protein